MHKLKTTTAVAGGLALAMMAGGALAQDQVTLNIWSDTPRLSMFELYDQTHDNVTLNVTTVAPADLIAKLQLAMQAKSEIPDVVFLSDIGYTAQLSTRRSNYLMDLTDKVPQALQDEFYPNGNSPCEVNGKLYCLRNDLAHMMVWYDKPLMEKLGKAVPTTYAEFEALGAELGPEGYVLGSAVEAFPLYSFLVSDGCDMAMPVEGKPDTLKIDLTTDKCTKPAAMVDAMVANGSLAKVGPFEPDFVNLAKTGKVPLIIGPTWFGEYVIKPTYEWPEGTLAAAMPLKWDDQDQPLTWSWGGGTYGGWKDTAHPDEVVDVIEWMATDVANQTDAVTLPAHEPSAIAWGAKLKADSYYADADVFDVEVGSAKYSHPGYVSLRFSVSDAIAKVITQGMGGGGTVLGALPALQTELTNLAKLNGYTVE
ncbi:extracellular solute-binding protein [Devosia rhodophyticola]|uniref:Extracellular solute-binding protein n=1 Tax=Devosia rhodophyticola TaxID=3026423 RepID=A0ABY7YVM7_9HYPH|nr:extracellular solute-binding protein [Devosia rhodophyticola]WDR05252.1 extracellular solute-binding protein [Devosia rhodophyticola]